MFLLRLTLCNLKPDYQMILLHTRKKGKAADSKDNERKVISYLEEDVEWHPSFGSKRRFNNSNEDSEWEEEEEANLVAHVNYMSFVELDNGTLYAMLSQVTQQIKNLGQIIPETISRVNTII
jgi:hypothetical protein